MDEYDRSQSLPGGSWRAGAGLVASWPVEGRVVVHGREATYVANLGSQAGWLADAREPGVAGWIADVWEVLDACETDSQRQLIAAVSWMLADQTDDEFDAADWRRQIEHEDIAPLDIAGPHETRHDHRIMDDMPRLLTGHQAAEVLGIAETTLSQWRHRGKGPPTVRVGGRVQYDADELRAWIDARRSDPRDATSER